MAKFEFHGQESLIDELEDELPRDGTPWDLYILEAVRSYQRKDPLPPDLSRSVSLAHELQDELPEDRDESIRYMREALDIRKTVESGEKLLMDRDDVLIDEHTI